MDANVLAALPRDVLVAKLKALQKAFDDERGDLAEINRDFALTRAELIRRGASERDIEWALAPSQA